LAANGTEGIAAVVVFGFTSNRFDLKWFNIQSYSIKFFTSTGIGNDFENKRKSGIHVAYVVDEID